LLHIRFKYRVREGMVIDVFPNLSEVDLLTFKHTSSVNDAKILPGDKIAAAACEDGMIYPSELAGLAQLGILAVHERVVSCLATSDKAPTLLVSGGEDGFVRIWDVAARSQLKELRTRGGRVRAIALSPINASICFTSHDDRGIRMWDLQKGEL